MRIARAASRERCPPLRDPRLPPRLGRRRRRTSRRPIRTAGAGWIAGGENAASLVRFVGGAGGIASAIAHALRVSASKSRARTNRCASIAPPPTRINVAPRATSALSTITAVAGRAVRDGRHRAGRVPKDGHTPGVCREANLSSCAPTLARDRLQIDTVARTHDDDRRRVAYE